MIEYITERGPYLLFAFLIGVSTYLLVSHRNLLKSVVGLYIFQTAIILFFIFLAVRVDGTVPIIEPILDPNTNTIPVLDNPLPHALMLTAIVVGVATLGVALAILRRIHEETGTIEDRDTGAGK
jgi:multicomponent Na+:H+ antiporter subunit C